MISFLVAVGGGNKGLVMRGVEGRVKSKEFVDGDGRWEGEKSVKY
jgi:hypothetical protein